MSGGWQESLSLHLTAKKKKKEKKVFMGPSNGQAGLHLCSLAEMEMERTNHQVREKTSDSEVCKGSPLLSLFILLRDEGEETPAR